MASALRLLRRDRSVSLADDQGLREAYQAHGAELYRYAVRALADQGAAEDAVQDTFVRAWRSADSYDEELSSLRVWLFAILRNVVIDHARKRSAKSWPQLAAGPDLPASSDTGPDPADQVLQTWLIEEGLRKLSTDHRDALVETYLRGRPYADVAAERGVPVATMRSRVFYALKALRNALDEMGVTP